jgi:hypothetical protein
MSTAAQIALAPPPEAVRRCQQCHKPDNVRVDLIDGVPEYEHTVKLVLKYIDRAEDQPAKPGGPEPLHIRRMRAKGWTTAPTVPVGTTSGRKALQAFLCVACINANELAGRMWGELKRNALAMEQKQKADENFYAILCEVEEA